MTSKPWKRQTGTRPKIRRGAGQMGEEEARKIREELEEMKKRYPENTVQMPPVYGRPAGTQRSYQAQPAQQAVVPLSNWWRAIVIIALAILVFIFLYNIVKVIAPNLSFLEGSGSGSGTASGCSTTCPGGIGVVVAPQCSCPAACPHYYIITNPPSMNGYKQCSA